MIRPDGLIVKLEAHDDIPYLSPTALTCRPVPAEGAVTLPHHGHAASPGAEDTSAARGAGGSEPIPSVARGAGDSAPIPSAARGAGDADGEHPLRRPDDPAPPAEPAGELADHMDCRAAEATGVDEEREALVIKDLFSSLLRSYPVQTTGSRGTTTALQRYRGCGETRRLYSDGSAELKAAGMGFGNLP